MNIANNILEKIGGTPLVRINKLNPGGAEVVVKVESFNPGGSVKDRIAFAMIDAAEKAGGGNLGISSTNSPHLYQSTSGVEVVFSLLYDCNRVESECLWITEVTYLPPVAFDIIIELAYPLQPPVFAPPARVVTIW